MTGIVTVGNPEGSVTLRIDRKFLELFSEHLYSSANKAFEELVSNSWDAGASQVTITFPDNLDDPNAAICVLDNGVSMNMDTLGDLWHIGASPKRTTRHRGRKNPIGKFGIGKLATYILASQITYVCKAEDGIIRIVSLDYSTLSNPTSQIEMAETKLPVRTVSSESLEMTLSSLVVGTDLIPSITEASSATSTSDCDSSLLTCEKSQGTWTLVILTSLKPKGRDIKIGRLRYMLSSSLPIGDNFSIQLNQDLLIPTKSTIPVFGEWSLGKLFSNSVSLSRSDQNPNTTDNIEVRGDVIHTTLLGDILGRVQVFHQSIAGGKSSELGASEGFFVFVHGRLVNPADTTFGLTNLKHGILTRFRAEIHCNALDEAIRVDREKLDDSELLSHFRDVLLKIFNRARTEWQAKQDSAVSLEVHSILDSTWNVEPIGPLQRFVDKALEAPHYVTSLLRVSEDEADTIYTEWRDQVVKSPKDVIATVEVTTDLSEAEPLSVYDVKRRTLFVNEKHPFVRRANSSDPPDVLRILTFANLLADSYLLDLGLSPSQIDDYVQYRDKMLRLVNRVERRDAITLIEMLEHAGSYSHGLETIVHEALSVLGFDVTPLAQSGEPEGYAEAILSIGTTEEDRGYRFTYDAKSSQSKVQTGNVNIAGLVRHREKYKAKHILVVGPKFQNGALEAECKQNKVTPMTCSTLAHLLRLTANFGRIALTRFESVFDQYSPEGSQGWATELESELKSSSRLTMDVLLDAIVARKSIKIALTPEILQEEIRVSTGNTYNVEDVKKVLHGLQAVAPAYIQSAPPNHWILNVEPNSLVEEVKVQLSRLRNGRK